MGKGERPRDGGEKRVKVKGESEGRKTVPPFRPGLPGMPGRFHLPIIYILPGLLYLRGARRG